MARSGRMIGFLRPVCAPTCPGTRSSTGQLGLASRAVDALRRVDDEGPLELVEAVHWRRSTRPERGVSVIFSGAKRRRHILI